MVIISAVSSANKELFVKNGLFLHMGLLACYFDLSYMTSLQNISCLDSPKKKARV